MAKKSTKTKKNTSIFTTDVQSNDQLNCSIQAVNFYKSLFKKLLNAALSKA